MTELRADSIFCDDIRVELNGKQILIGVYTGDILTTQFPVMLHLSVWCRVTGLPAGKHSFEFSLDVGNGNKIGLRGEIELKPGQPSVLAFGGLPISVNETTELIAAINFDEHGFLPAGSIKVLLGSAGQPTV